MLHPSVLRWLAVFVTTVVIVLVWSTAVWAQASGPATVKLNVFAVVSPNLEEAARLAGQALELEEGLQTFPQLGFQIHCTLYMTRFAEDRQSDVLEKVKELAARVKEFSVKTTGLELTSGNWFFLNLDRAGGLQALSDSVVQRLAPLRFPDEHVPDWAKPFPQKVEYITTWGSPNVFAEFNPHLTLLARADPEKLRGFLARHANNPAFGAPLEGKIVAIGVGVADGNGQIKDPLVILPLN
jgi:hypothetical protein